MITAAVANAGGREEEASFHEASHRKLTAAAEAGDLGALREEFSVGGWLVLGPDTVTAAARARSLPCLAYLLDERKCAWNPAACARAAVEGTGRGGTDGGDNAIAALEYIFENCEALSCFDEHTIRRASITAAARTPGEPSVQILEHLLHTYPATLEDDFLEGALHEAIYAGNLGALWVLWEAGAEIPYTDTDVPPAYIEGAAWEKVKVFWEEGWAAAWAAGERPPPSVKPAAYS